MGVAGAKRLGESYPNIVASQRKNCPNEPEFDKFCLIARGIKIVPQFASLASVDDH